MKICILTILFSLGLSQSFVPLDRTQNISITVHHIRSAEGLIRLAVYDRADKFNKEAIHELSFSKAAMRNGALQCDFELAKGRYAFSLLDDENGDNEMNYNLVGVPKEGFGFSRDAKINFMTAPDFDDCALQVEDGGHSGRIKVRYF